VGQKVTVSAVVTAYMPGLSGFFVQEEEGDSDGDAATSEGVFVYYGNANPGVDEGTVGKLVQVSASVSEFRNQTQLSAVTDFVAAARPPCRSPCASRCLSATWGSGSVWRGCVWRSRPPLRAASWW
jgi:predicted extracellular nuclease